MLSPSGALLTGSARDRSKHFATGHLFGEALMQIESNFQFLKCRALRVLVAPKMAAIAVHENSIVSTRVGDAFSVRQCPHQIRNIAITGSTLDCFTNAAENRIGALRSPESFQCSFVYKGYVGIRGKTGKMYVNQIATFSLRQWRGVLSERR